MPSSEISEDNDISFLQPTSLYMYSSYISHDVNVQWLLPALCYVRYEEKREGRERAGNQNTHTQSHTLKKTWQWTGTQAVWGLEFLRGRSEHMTRTIFDKATRSLGTIRVMSKVALIAGSSQQGKALRASVAWREEADREKGHNLRLCVPSR